MIISITISFSSILLQFNHRIRQIRDFSLVLIVLSHNKKEPKIHHIKQRNKPVIIIQARIIKVVENPPFPTTLLRHARHRGQHEATKKIPNSQTRRKTRRPQTLHTLRRLVVEELRLGDLHERVGQSEEEELREQHEDCERHLPAALRQAVVLSDGEAVHFGESGDDHDEDVEGAVVDYDAEEHGEGDHADHGGGREIEVADFSVECDALLHEKRDRHIPLLESSNDDPSHLRNGASQGFLVPIEGRAGQENDERHREADGGKAVADRPPNVVLNVHNYGVGKESAQENAEKPPVEEGELLGLLFGVVHVELVGGDGRDVGLRAAVADS
nr:Os05g0336000 [Ipomoea trifida]